MAPSILSPISSTMDGVFRNKRISSSRRVSGINDTESVASGAGRSVHSPRATSRKFNSIGATNISSVVTSIQRRSGDELGANAASRLFNSTHDSVLEWIRSERLSLLPPEGSDYDKVLTWAQLFIDRLHSFDLEIEQFAGDSYLAAQLSYGYCALLLELGRENASALMVSFGFFYSISMTLLNLLERTELFSVTQEIQEQLILALSDLVTLVASVSTHFHNAISGMTTASVSVNIYRTFPGQIQTFQQRCEKISESMWRHQLLRENLDGDKVSDVKAIRAWLAPEDRVIANIADHTSHLAHDREELTCLWMAPYLTRFLKTQQKHLSITGQPGSGKTVLASVIVDHLQHPHAGVSYQTLFVPINGRIAAQTSSYAIAKTILSQLFAKRIGNVQLFRILSNAFNLSKVTSDYQAYDSLLWDAVEQALSSSLKGAKDLVLVVDGADEATCGEDQLLQRLTRASSKASNVKLITLGNQTAPDAGGLARVRITDDIIFDDISAVVRGCFGRSSVYQNLPDVEQETLVERIAQASNSSFLAAKLITKKVRREQTPETLRKAVDGLLSSKPAVTDFVGHALQHPDVTPEAKQALVWLATAERPLHVQELSALLSVQPDKQTVTDAPVDPMHVLRPLNSLVFVEYDYFYVRHTLIRNAVVDIFNTGKLIPTVKDRHFDLVTRMLVYTKTKFTDPQEPSSLPSLDYHDTNALVDKYPLLDFALRYWIRTFRQTTVFTKDGESPAAKEITKLVPTSTTVVRLLRSILDNVSTPYLVTLLTTVTNVYRTILTNDNVTTLQSIITLATLFRQVNHPDTFTLFYDAAILSQKLLTTKHIVTQQMVTIFLELTTVSITDSRTDIMVKREEMLQVLVECYKIHFGKTSQKVITVLQQLVEHYRKVEDTKKAESIIATLQSLTSTDYGTTTNGSSGTLDVRLVGRRSSGDTGYLFNLEFNEEDNLLETTESLEVEDLVKLAEKYLQQDRADLAERLYVEFWQRATRESRVHSSALWDEKKIKVILAYSSFLRTQKREHEASSILTSFWQDHQHTSVSLSETTAVHLEEIAKVVKSVGLTTLALSVFKQVSEYYQSTRRTETSSYKEVQQQLHITSQEVMKSASASSIVSESTLEEMILETSSSSKSVDQSFYGSAETLVGLYISQRRWQHATRTIKQILRNTWSTFFAATLQDVTIPQKHVDSSLALAERLAQCYHSRHRLGKEQDIRFRIYYAVRSGLNVEDKLRQHHVTELLRVLERTSQTDLIINVYQELLNDYTKHYGPEHPTVIQTLRTLATLTRPRPIFLDYLQRIIQALNKDGKYHPDSIEPLDTVATELWNQGRYSDALHYWQILFTAWLNQPKLSPKFQDEKFVQNIFTRYTQCLRSVRTEFSVIYKVTLDFQTKVKAVFTATATITVQATLSLAQLCQDSRQHEVEAIRLYEELLKINSNVVNLDEIRATLDSLYEEQSALLSKSQLESASSTQVEQAVKVLRKRVTTLRESYGWAHEESLTRMKEVISFYSKQNKTESIVQELQDATIQILSHEKSTTRLSEAAATIVSSYIATNQTHKAVELSNEVYRQVIRKDSSNVQSSKFDLTSKSRQSLIFLAQLEHQLHRQNSTVTEILASLTTELVYFEDFQQLIKSSSSFSSVSSSAARLYYFLITNARQQVAVEITNEFISYFLATEGKTIGFKSSAEVKVFIMMVLNYFSTRQSQDIVRSIGIASNSHVLELLKLNKYDEAVELALASFKYIAAQQSYRTPGIARYVLALSMNISGRGLTVDAATHKKLISASATIIQDVLKVLGDLKINLAQVGLEHLNSLIGLLGEQANYQTLAAVLTSIWHSREAQRDWDPYITLALGRLYIMVRYFIGDTTSAVRLAEDIVYNCRRVHGARHPSTLEMSVLLSQLYTGIGQRYQSQKETADLAGRYYKRSAALHENVLRALSDPTFADFDDSFNGSELGDSVEAESFASEEQVKHHFKLFKLSIQRLGAWPKDFSEYERLNADLYREYPTALKGIEGVDKWDLKGFGAGKAESAEDLVDKNFSDWRLFDERKLVNGDANGVIEEEL